MVKLKFPIKNLLAINDPREVPAYSIPLAAHYLRLPPSTLRDWVRGGEYHVASGVRRFKPLIALPNPKVHVLSFYNLAEAHVLSALRRTHNVRMQAIRKALDYVTNEYGWKRPLIQHNFMVAGASMFVERLDHELVDAGTSGKQLMLGFINQYLHRLEWEGELATKLYPFTRKDARAKPEDIGASPRMVLIDPRYSFGRPMLVNIRIPTAVIAERYKAGESTKHLAQDYACPVEEIEEAVRCELNIPVAA